MTSELRPALAVWADTLLAYHDAQQNPKGRPNKAAAAIIEADREAVRAEQAAEIAALKSAWKAQHKEKVAERAEAKLWFMQAQEAKTELAKFKALAETLAGALDDVISATCAYLPPDGISKGECINMVIAATDNMEVMEALRQYKEARDAS